MAYVPNELLSRLVGFRLYSVHFVMDYVQLGFDSETDETASMNCDVWPDVTLEARSSDFIRESRRSTRRSQCSAVSATAPGWSGDRARTRSKT